MAEGLLRQASINAKVTSAGLGALVGQPADPISIKLMAEAGLDISQHRARQLTRMDTREADLILVMESDHKIEIQQRYPMAFGKVFRLGETDKFDIPDPYGQSRHAFEVALERIQHGVQAWVPRIRALLECTGSHSVGM